MKLLQEGVFTGEIIFQAELVINGSELLKKAVEENDRIQIWSSIQTILISSGNISKILWPIKQHKERGTKLRKLLKIDSNCILSNRAFRNKFEHYDNLIDDFFNNVNTSSYIDLVMNPSMLPFGIESCHRGYNTHDNTLVIRGEILDLNTVIRAVEDVKLKCKSLYVKVF